MRKAYAHGTCASMGAINTPRVRKRSTNVSLDEALVRDAKALGIGVSAACEQGLAAALKKERERRWIEENADAIKKYNEWLAINGNPLAKYRMF